MKNKSEILKAFDDAYEVHEKFIEATDDFVDTLNFNTESGQGWSDEVEAKDEKI